MERVVNLIARHINAHGHGQTGALNPFVKRAKITRQPVGQHRHHTVRKIGGIATLAGFAVQCGPRRDIMCDIRNRDPNDKAACVFWVRVCLNETGIIMVAGIPRINRDQRHIAQVFAPLQPCWRGGICFGDDLIGEMVRNAVLMNCDQRDRTRFGRITKPGDDARFGQAHAALWSGLLGLDQFAVLGTTGRTGGDGPLFVCPLVDRQHPPAFRARAKHPQNTQRIGTDAPDHAGGMAVVFGLIDSQAAQNTVAGAEGRIT